MEPVWDFETLWSWFEPRIGVDVVETELLRTFFPEEDLFADGVSLDLYHKHFLLYRRLWLFDDEVRLASGHRLWIRSIRSTLMPPPPAGQCGWLDPDTGEFCPRAAHSENLCPQHASTTPEVNSLKGYYLDWNNLEGMTEERLTTMVEDFFRWMGYQGASREALAVLGLPEGADAEQIRTQWRRLSLEHHPDRGGDGETFKKISAAWTALKASDERLR